MNEQTNRVWAELDQQFSDDPDYLRRVGSINSNRQIAEEIMRATQLESDPSLTHGFWEDEAGQAATLSQWPDLWSLWQLMDQSEQWNLIRSSPPFQAQYREFRLEWTETMANQLESQAAVDSRFLQEGPAAFLQELSHRNFLPPLRSLYQDQTVQSALISYAVDVATFREWTLPQTLGQAVVVLNLAIGVEQGVFELDSSQQSCLSDWYQKIVHPQSRNETS